MILTDDDMRRLTGKMRPSAQTKVLREMLVPFRLRPDGKPIVLWPDITGDKQTAKPAAEPDFSHVKQA